MMKQLFVGVFALMLLAVGPAQAQDAKAKSILEAASKKMNGLKTLKATFVLKLLGNGGAVRDTKKGTFLMKGSKYHIALAGQEIICDGKTVWTYMKDANEVQVSNYNAEEQSISPMKLFTNFYDKEYNYRHVGTRKVAGKTANIIEMTPVNKSKQFN